MSQYRWNQLSNVDYKGEYPAKIKIVNMGDETKWLDITHTELLKIIKLLKVNNKD